MTRMSSVRSFDVSSAPFTWLRGRGSVERVLNIWVISMIAVPIIHSADNLLHLDEMGPEHPHFAPFSGRIKVLAFFGPNKQRWVSWPPPAHERRLRSSSVK
jgi:hypothetical protein